MCPVSVVTVCLPNRHALSSAAQFFKNQDSHQALSGPEQCECPARPRPGCFFYCDSSWQPSSNLPNMCCVLSAFPLRRPGKDGLSKIRTLTQQWCGHMGQEPVQRAWPQGQVSSSGAPGGATDPHAGERRPPRPSHCPYAKLNKHLLLHRVS